MLIDKILALCCTRRNGTIFAIVIIATFFILSLTRHYDFETFQSILSDTGNDWSVYARHALEIKQNGILMPSIKGTYYFPAGYLYNYFIALCLVLFGERSYPIFIVQHLMLGFSVALVYWTFRDKMKNLTATIFLVALFIFAFKDVYKNYSPLLLSENLAIFTVSLFFFCFVKGFDKDNFVLQLIAALSMGLSVLTRPNIALYAILLIPLVAVYYLKKRKIGFIKLTVFAITLLLSSSLLLIRNYLVCKKPLFLPAQVASVMGYIKNFNPVPPSVDLSRVNINLLYTKLHLNKDIVDYAEYMLQQPRMFFTFYLKKILFCLGYLPVFGQGQGIRWHWVIMWVGYFTYLFLRIKNRKKWGMWEVAVHLYILCYYASLIMSASIHNYGFRMLLPVIFFVLPFAFMALDMLWSGIISYRDKI
ncbi:MAG: glycosyltransferase family 39 protein [Candidatus Omnitrophica bacterium]|nr:glycosyltransferase family 39 protein [Candidatus Omnitrophota bacterium]